MIKQSIAVALALCFAACGARPPSPAAQQPTTLTAYSTVGFGCPCPPFRRSQCDPTTETEKNPADCYFLTRTTTKLGGPWDFAEANGKFKLVGRWSGEKLTYTEWLTAQSLTPPEGAEPIAKLPVFEVESYCLDSADVARHEADIAAMSENGDRSAMRKWLHAHACP